MVTVISNSCKVIGRKLPVHIHFLLDTSNTKDLLNSIQPAMQENVAIDKIWIWKQDVFNDPQSNGLEGISFPCF